jgi:hypothetical protein
MTGAAKTTARLVIPPKARLECNHAARRAYRNEPRYALNMCGNTGLHQAEPQSRAVSSPCPAFPIRMWCVADAREAALETCEMRVQSDARGKRVVFRRMHALLSVRAALVESKRSHGCGVARGASESGRNVHRTTRNERTEATTLTRGHVGVICTRPPAVKRETLNGTGCRREGGHARPPEARRRCRIGAWIGSSGASPADAPRSSSSSQPPSLFPPRYDAPTRSALSSARPCHPATRNDATWRPASEGTEASEVVVAEKRAPTPPPSLRVKKL